MKPPNDRDDIFEAGTAKCDHRMFWKLTYKLGGITTFGVNVSLDDDVECLKPLLPIWSNFIMHINQPVRSGRAYF